MARSSSANIFRSSYRDSFVAKRTTRVNIKELDACKDKIKYPISYSGISPSIIAREIERYPECCITISAKNDLNRAATSKRTVTALQVSTSSANHVANMGRRSSSVNKVSSSIKTWTNFTTNTRRCFTHDLLSYT